MKEKGGRMKVWMVLALSGIAFLGVLVAFACEIRSSRAALIDRAVEDLQNRAQLAVLQLAEPLRTSDFTAIRSLNGRYAAEGIRLSIFGKPKGLVFDSLGGYNDPVRDSRYFYSAGEDVGAFTIHLGIPFDRVLAPFYRARRSFALSALAGILGMFIVFFVFYRQRVRIRELAKLERFRREFIADVSHEIKTPLTGILGAVEMMGGGEGGGEGGGGGGQGKVLISLIKKEAGRLNGLVQSILDLARLEREGDALSRTEFDLAEMLQELAVKYGVGYDGSQGGSTIVFADAELVRQALSNLVENAKKYSGTDDISLSLSCTDGWRHIVVEDHGVGIPSEHAARVFERFYRVDAARSAETGGAGLGLAIVRRIAELHGGAVTLVAAKPHGCRFDFSLPI